MADDTINIVVLGSDRRPHWDDWHTDVVQVVSIQPAVPAVTILSIPRDLYLYIPGFWMSRINFADMYGEQYDYPGGGPALVQQTLLYNLGIPVHLYVRTDFEGFVGIVNVLGGIDIPVHCRLQDYWPVRDASGRYPIKTLEPGFHHMDGDTALWYARSRKTTSLFSREERQQAVLYAIWDKARSAGFLAQIPDLWQQLREMVVTDIQFADVLKLADVALRIEESDVRFRNIGAYDVIPWRTPYGGAVLLPNWNQIGPIVAEALAPVPEGRLERARQPIEVWNGTPNADWDLLAIDRLVHEGYAPALGAPDRTDYARTILIDFTTTSKGSAVPYLQEMFGLTADDIVSMPDPSSEVRYRLIIGADYETCPSP
jgi:LCP family protein required for cell wall assembly